ncbi:unnamed protein product [Colias eurytheme]|nr:unnamed protein product [Colias eurytheme]
MDLHLHLSVAFRALDYKWGLPIDLDSPAEPSSCIPVEIDLPKTTFSSEEYLNTVKRSRRVKAKRKDSFSDISVSKMASTSDLGYSETISMNSFTITNSRNGVKYVQEWS